MITTTLNKIYAHNPCQDGWEKLLVYLGKTEPDDDPVSVLVGLESNGLDDTLWALRAVDGYDREIRLFACKCACRVLHVFESEYPNDLRPRQAIETAALYAEGLATEEELATARDAAGTARSAARDAAWDAARAAIAAARAARAAAWATAWAAARDAARAAEREYQIAELIKLCTEGRDYEKGL